MNKKTVVPNRIILSLLFFALLFSACGPLKEVIITPETEEVHVSRILSAMKANEASFEFFSARFSGDVSFDNSTYSISGIIRIRKDSAIFVSLSPIMGIEMARALITPDDVKIINRLEGTYFEGDMDYVNNMLGTELDFYMLQALLVGNDFSHLSSENFSVKPETNRLLLQNPQRYPATSRANNQFFQQNLLLDNQSYKITENTLYDPLTRRSIRTRYSAFYQVTGQLMPSRLSVIFTEPGAQAELNIRYNRTSIDNPQPITFSVPERYRPVDGNH